MGLRQDMIDYLFSNQNDPKYSQLKIATMYRNKLLTAPPTFKTYNELCEYLGLAPTTGKAKQLQLEKLQQYARWERDGHTIILKEVYTIPTHLDLTKNNNYQEYFNVLVLYDILFGQREEGYPDEMNYNSTQLKQSIYKLINKEFYDARKDTRAAALRTGVSEEFIKFADKKISDKLASLSNRILFENNDDYTQCFANHCRRLYYVDLDEYIKTNKFVIRQRDMTIKETSVYMSAQIAVNRKLNFPSLCSDNEEDEDDKDIDGYNKDDENDNRHIQMVEATLKLINGATTIEEAVLQRGNYLNGIKNETSQTIDEYALATGNASLFSIHQNEFWINVVETIKFAASQSLIKCIASAQLFTPSITFVSAQMELNNFMIDWIKTKATTTWVDFVHKNKNQIRANSKDIPKDMEKFIKKYVVVNSSTEGPGYEWKTYTDEDKRKIELRFANNNMTFTEANLSLFRLVPSVGAGPAGVVLWDTPCQNSLCTNNKELLGTIGLLMRDRGVSDIPGYLGEVRVDAKGGTNCLIMNMDPAFMQEVKTAWGKIKEKEAPQTEPADQPEPTIQDGPDNTNNNIDFDF